MGLGLAFYLRPFATLEQAGTLESDIQDHVRIQQNSHSLLDVLGDK